ncbi:MAG: FAD-dependent oxidoreductase, partial [Oscillospiraceae bacterium]|nr:FAD-dependent oxidoreductase [Oscillospiraceae bacterium]
MLQIERIKLNLNESEDLLRHRAAAVLRVSPNDLQTLTILRRSVDARDGVQFVYTLRVSVKNEKEVLRRCRSRAVSRAEDKPYR